MSSRPHLYYKAFDGFRGFSALLVFGHHFLGLPYGWTGVDLFFVLSGFLITGILFDSQDAPHRFRTFYIRRSLRIFPLYYAVLAFAFLTALVRHMPKDPGQILWPLYLGNYVQLVFPARDLQFLGWLLVGHLWTLSIEEQFYLVWPTVVYKLPRRDTLIRICISVIVLTPLARFALLHWAPAFVEKTDIVFRGTPFRCDSLLLGALCALWMRGPEHAPLRRAAAPMLCIAGGLFAAIALYVRLGLHHHGSLAQQPWIETYGLTLIDIAAAGALIIASDESTWLARIFRNKPLSHFGRLTYGFYVYHALFLRQLERLQHHMLQRGIPHMGAKLATAAVAFALAYTLAALSYRFFEKPFIDLKDRFAPSTAPGSQTAATAG